MSLSKYIKLRKKSDIMRAKVQKYTESLGIDLNKSGNIVSDCTGIVLGRYSHNALLYLKANIVPIVESLNIQSSIKRKSFKFLLELTLKSELGI